MTQVHTAPGQMAGYLFQPDRALVLLCACNNDESISIEMVDDLAIMDAKGEVTYREQDKHSIVATGSPLTDRSRELWNTLSIWTDDCKSGKLIPESTRLVCVTNKALDPQSLLKIISAAVTSKDVEKAFKLLKSAGKKPSDTIKPFVTNVLNDDALAKRLLTQITLVEESDLTERTEEIANKLGLNDDIKKDVITDLRGWLNEVILAAFDKGEAPLIKKKNFNNRVQHARQKVGDKRVKVLAKLLVQKERPVSDAEIETAKIDSTFVKQLEAIEHPLKNEIIVDAITDFLLCEHHRSKLVEEGEITSIELAAMDFSSHERWKTAFQRKMTSYNISMSDEEMGKLAHAIYDETLNGYLCKLRGFDTEEYFTKGSFLKLSDRLEIGWHPKWTDLFKK
ncbi:MAG TPA: hypothetical protein PKL56_16775 [Cyclobacteriaceae bacterium]|nr:hypothetical protein [Cyclobacteriaceae bacterium]HMX01919.1 hypothetical protein [Cyclobacteriaceae bacterium]HMX50842.1 hypothetical protein [Cyclobacteriaceae bacterium]HMY94742.1 hypothetical protein [Cyclobacteriaceae bacterium]HNA13639.1 hypothetical protein [Cyclobacteriaceae bacterium]